MPTDPPARESVSVEAAVERVMDAVMELCVEEANRRDPVYLPHIERISAAIRAELKAARHEASSEAAEGNEKATVINSVASRPPDESERGGTKIAAVSGDEYSTPPEPAEGRRMQGKEAD